MSEKRAKREKEAVRLNVYLPSETIAVLEELQKLSGKRSMAETIRAALNVCLAVQQELKSGKEFYVQDTKTKEREKLRFVTT